MIFPLPDTDVLDGLVRGRSPRDGYQRGWGLQFGGLVDRVRAEDLYIRAASEAAMSWVSEPKRMNLYLIMTRFLPKLKAHNIVEFGSYRGGNALFMSVVMREVAPEARVYALDTFAGMPNTDKSVDAHSNGDFADADLSVFRQRAEDLRLDNLHIAQGLFDETFPTISKGTEFGLAHIDADIYASVKYAQDAVWPTMTEGGYVVYDDAEISSCLGATQAVEDLVMERRIHSEQVWPHFVFRAGFVNSE